MGSEWRGGRPRGPVRAATEEARELAVFLRERVDLSGKTYRQLADEIYVSRTQISEFLGGKVPHKAFVLALIRATTVEPSALERAERRALKLLEEARRSMSPSSAGPSAASFTTPSSTPPVSAEASVVLGADFLHLMQRRVELEREVAELRSERDRLQREERHTHELNHVREALARAEAEAHQAGERQLAAERAVAQERGRAQHLTQQLSILGLSGVVPDSLTGPPDNGDNAVREESEPDNTDLGSTGHAGPTESAGAAGPGRTSRSTSPYVGQSPPDHRTLVVAGPVPLPGTNVVPGADELKEMWAEAAAAADVYRASEAVRLYAELVVANQRHLGPDHPDTLTARHNLAAWRGEEGDAAGAVIAFTGLLPHRDRVLGADHPDTLATRHNLAHWRGTAGDAHGAVADFAALLPDALRVLGPDAPDTLSVRHALAVWRGEAGDADGAATALYELLRHRSRVLGEDHPDTLAARSDMAQWEGVSGHTASAVSGFSELLPDAVRVLGEDHMYTLIIRHNLAAWQGVAGDTSGAAARLSELFPDTLRTLGRRHTHTQTIRQHLAFWQRRSQT